MEKQIETKEELLTFLRETRIDWRDVKWAKPNVDIILTSRNKDELIPSDDIGPVCMVAEHGGEGQGDEYWVVAYFKKFDAYVRVDGYYTSYDGGYLDGSPYFVAPVEKTVIVYNKI